MDRKSHEQLVLRDELELEADTEDVYNRQWEEWFEELSTEQRKQWTGALWRTADAGGDDAELLELERLWEAPAMPEDLDLTEALVEY